MHAKWRELASADYRFVTHISYVYLAIKLPLTVVFL